MSDWNTYPRCIECERPMRQPRTRAADHPGTIQFNSHGRCTTCAERLRRSGLIKKQPRPIADIPGTTAGLAAYLKWRAPFRAARSAEREQLEDEFAS